MKKNVFAAGVTMAAIALVGFGAVNNTIIPSIRVEAASVQSADDAVKQLIADQIRRSSMRLVIPVQASRLSAAR